MVGLEKLKPPSHGGERGSIPRRPIKPNSKERELNS